MFQSVRQFDNQGEKRVRKQREFIIIFEVQEREN